jgi:MATE family multidrug resistance protein
MHRQIWAMAAPIVLTNVSVPFLGAVDTAVVGHLPEPFYIGAVAIGAMLFNYIYHLFNCLRMGTTGPTAQALGAGHYAEVRAIVYRALSLALAIGLLVIALQAPILSFALWFIDASAEVERYARVYFLIRIWALPAVLGVFAIIGWCYGLKDVRSPLLILCFSNGLNTGLDFLFVFGFGWDVAGVAAASLIAAYAGLFLGLYFVRRNLGGLPDEGPRSRILDPVQVARMVSINGDIVLRTFCVVSVLAIFMSKSAQLGDLTLATNQVLHNFLVFTSFALDGIAHAAEAILGAQVGRRDRAAFVHGMRVVLGWAGLFGVLTVAVYALLGPLIVDLLTSIPEVRAGAAAFLLWPILMPLVSIWAYTYDGIYLAATRTKIMRNTVVASFLVFLALVHLLVPAFGNSGLWMALMAYLGTRGLLLHLTLPMVLRAIRAPGHPEGGIR